ncbi:MAG: sensor histidine kinase, partial [Candidatus Binatia bacterium]
HYVREETIAKSSFYSIVGIIDILLVTLALAMSRQTSTDFYMVYFLILIISALSRELKWILISTVLVMVLYGFTLLFVTDQRTLDEPAILLRFPFFFIIAIFYGYLVQSVRKEKLEREKLAQEEVNRLKAKFLGHITNGLLGPMNVMTGYIHLMLTGASGDLTLEQIRIIDHLQLNAERLLRSIRELVELSNIDAKKVTLQVQRGEIRPFLEKVRTEILEQLRQTPLQVELATGDSLSPVETDWRMLRQAMLHILANVAQLAPSGRITLLAGRRAKADEVTIAVTDAGGKFDTAEIGTVLNQFAETETFHGDESSAMGLRLAVAKNLVDLLGGKMHVRSGTGKALNFAITIPVSWADKPKEAVEINFVGRLSPMPGLVGSSER